VWLVDKNKVQKEREGEMRRKSSVLFESTGSTFGSNNIWYAWREIKARVFCMDVIDMTLWRCKAEENEM
jgi:hypothetical protein